MGDTQLSDEAKVLSEEEVAEIEAINQRCRYPYVDALCATVRALNKITTSLVTENDLERKQSTALREQLAQEKRDHADTDEELQAVQSQLAQVEQERDGCSHCTCICVNCKTCGKGLE